MFGNESDKDINIASGNKIGSDNTAKISLFNIENDFTGLEKIVALLFPSIRHAIVERYRAETSAKILLEANRLAQNENIQINPIPPKIALPIFEKMSLEHEEEMYEKWAELLIAASVKPDPIHQQYADILASLNNRRAMLLKEIFSNQTDPNMEGRFEDYMDSLRFNKKYKQINAETKMRNFGRGGSGVQELFPITPRVTAIKYPYYMTATEKNGDRFLFTNEEKNMFMGLERLGLIKYLNTFYDSIGKENEKIYNVYQCGMLLTKFGYAFVDCLEHPTEGR
jgi:hypothetical protein